MSSRGTLLAVTAVVWLSLAHGQARAEPIAVIEHNDSSRWLACAHFESAPQRRECYYRDADTKWSITIYEGGGIPGAPDANIIVPKVLEVLQEIVDECELGKTHYIRATDGVAHLYVGNPDLNPSQIGCIRKAERLGLWLREETN